MSALNRRFAPAPVKPTSPRFSIGAQASDEVACHPSWPERPCRVGNMSKKTKKRKIKARRNKANHGKRPNAGRR